MAKTTIAVSLTEARAKELREKAAEIGCSVSFLVEILTQWGLNYLKEGKEDKHAV